MNTTLDHASLGPDAGHESADDFDDVLRALSRAPAVRLADIDLVGRTVGRFVVKRRLGEGGMGIVYEAFDPVLGRAVALKVLRASHRESGATRSRLHEEARRVAALHHPHIATVYDAGEHEGIVFLALERAAGRSLRARLSAPPALALQRTIAILRAIAAGLACAHEAGIVHRDLKPENVVVGDDGTVKIIDFGIAAASGQSGVSTPNARPAGTRRYMAPEHAAGAPASTRADVYAFGVLAREVLSATVVPARERSTRAALMRVITRCTAQAPGDRPADGAALLAALDAITSPGRGLTSATLAAALGAGAVAALMGIVTTRTAASTAQQPAPPPPTTADASQRPPTPRAAAPQPRPAATTAAGLPDVKAPQALDDSQPSDQPTPPFGGAPSPVISPIEERGGLFATRSPGSAPAAAEAPDAADPSGPWIPVTFVDDRGHIVATVNVDRRGGAAGPKPRTSTGTAPTTTLHPVAPLGPGSAEAEVVSDGQGGTFIHLKVHVPPSRPSRGDAGSNQLPGKPPPTLHNNVPKGVSKELRDLLLLHRGKGASLDAYGDPEMATAGYDEMFCSDEALVDVRLVALPGGSLELTAASHDEGRGYRKLLAVISENGEVTVIDEAICVCQAENEPGMDG